MQPISGSAPAAATISSTSTPAAPVATTSASGMTAVAGQSRVSWKLVVLGILLLVALGVGVGFYWRAHQTPKLTDKDQLILADFTNNTGDTVFDSTLKEALAIQLEQSPIIQLVSDAELHNNLQYLGQTKDQRITPELAQQIGQRLGVKSLSLGNYRSSRFLLRDLDQRRQLRHRRRLCSRADHPPPIKPECSPLSPAPRQNCVFAWASLLPRSRSCRPRTAM